MLQEFRVAISSALAIRDDRLPSSRDAIRMSATCSKVGESLPPDSDSCWDSGEARFSFSGVCIPQHDCSLLVVGDNVFAVATKIHTDDGLPVAFHRGC